MALGLIHIALCKDVFSNSFFRNFPYPANLESFYNFIVQQFVSAVFTDKNASATSEMVIKYLY